jgi:hypothetical protein
MGVYVDVDPRDVPNHGHGQNRGVLLNEIARLLEAGRLRSIRAETLSPINSANLREARAWIESGRPIGKLVLAGWFGVTKQNHSNVKLIK